MAVAVLMSAIMAKHGCDVVSKAGIRLRRNGMMAGWLFAECAWAASSMTRKSTGKFSQTAIAESFGDVAHGVLGFKQEMLCPLHPHACQDVAWGLAVDMFEAVT